MERFRNVTVGIDLRSGDWLVGELDELSEGSRSAWEQASWLARRTGASLHLLAALEVGGTASDVLERHYADRRDSILRRARE